MGMYETRLIIAYSYWTELEMRTRIPPSIIVRGTTSLHQRAERDLMKLSSYLGMTGSKSDIGFGRGRRPQTVGTVGPSDLGK